MSSNASSVGVDASAGDQAATRPSWVEAVGIVLAVIVILGFLAVRFVDLRADPGVVAPNKTGSFYGDEGLWYSANLWQQTQGTWHRPGEYNPAVVLPVMPLLVAGAAAVSHADTWYLCRFVTALVVGVSMVVLVIAVWRSCGRWPALIAGLLWATSYAFFVYSRVGLLDGPAAGFAIIGLSLLLGWRGPRPAWATVAAAGVGVVAVMCKSTMLAVMPAYLVAAWMTPPPGAPRWRDPLIGAVVGALLMGAYLGLLRGLFPDDVAMFREFNLRPKKGDNSLFDVARLARLIGEWIFGLGLVCVPLALWKLRGRRGYPWVVAASVWALLLLAAIVYRNLMVPRYFLPLVPPIAVVIGLVTVHGLREDAGRIAGVALCLIVLVAAGRGIVDITGVLRRPQYTYRDMGADIRRRAEAYGDPSQIVLWGHWPIGSVGLAANMPTHMLLGDPDAALRRYGAVFLLTYGPLDHPLERQRAFVERATRHHDLELVTTYEVLPEHATISPLVHLYHMKPRDPS